jgi:uncharacterized protein (TIGR03435 family)
MGRGPTRFDIAARMPQGASEHQVPEMIQALLAERFKLAAHRGTLLVMKGGVKVKEAAPEKTAPIPVAAPTRRPAR